MAYRAERRCMAGMEDEENVSHEEDYNRSYRRGGPQGEDDDEDEDAKRKAEERERKKAEVRKRLEEAGKAKKAKKGFLTPDRKKKLRKLLMMKASEDLKQQQLLKEQERNRVLKERIIPLPDVDGMTNQSELEKLAQNIHKRLAALEEEKYDMEIKVKEKEHEINELTIQVNDLRGKFVKPALKKISKYDNKFLKMKQQADGEKKSDLRTELKKVKKATVEDLMVEKKKEGKPEWAAKKGGRPEEEGGAPPAEAPAAEAVEAE